MATIKSVRHHAARVGGLETHPHKSSPEQLAEARRDLRAAQLKQAIEKAVAQAPPLTAQQAAELQTLLWSGVAQK